jgi:iron(III) transport system ATP-binding protein
MTTTADGLEVRNLKRIFASSGSSKPIGLHSVSFTLKPGTFFTLLGPSGCGKTTTLRCVAGLEVPDSGRISLGNRAFFDSVADVNVPLHRRNIGMVFQSYAIWPHMTVGQNVAFPLRMAKDEKFGAEAIRSKVHEALDLVGLADLAGRHPYQLSGGQQQRVALARALVRKPSLLLLDEPLSNLDAVLRDEMRSELRRLQRQLGITTIYVTHDQGEALEMSDLIGVMKGGHIMQLATPQEVYFQPSNLFVAQFLGAKNLLEGKVSVRANGDGIGQVTLTDGRTIRSRLSDDLNAEGQAVCIYLRPEALAVTAGATDGAAGNVVQGDVISSGFLGHTSRVRVKVGDTVIEANTGHQNPITEGQRVSVVFGYNDTVSLPVPAEA